MSTKGQIGLDGVRVPKQQGFSALARLHCGLGKRCGGAVVLCIIGYLAASMASTHWKLVAPHPHPTVSQL